MTLTTEKNWLKRDLSHNWHPCSQMKDFEQFPPFFVTSAEGSYLNLSDGRRVVDGISSWWCKSLGHRHPKIQEAIRAQLSKFEHVMFGNTTYDAVIQLSEKLSRLLPGLTRVMYASDGSSAVEIALKMSLHARQISGEMERTEFLCLENAYHGETALTMSVSDLGKFRQPYEAILTKTHVLKNIPYVSGVDDPRWEDCSTEWPAFERHLEAVSEKLTAIIVEPIVQGAAGMRIYSQDFLRRLFAWSRAKKIHFIADEIMTGFWRTGRRLACDYAGVIPDFLCLGKALTAGALPLSAVLTSDAIYENFYGEEGKKEAFLHSHTHTGNALAVSAALAAMEVMESEKISQRMVEFSRELQRAFRDVQDETTLLKNCRGIGGIVAGKCVSFEKNSRLSFEFSKRALEHGAFLRPIGNTVYWFPPLNSDFSVIEELKNATIQGV